MRVFVQFVIFVKMFNATENFYELVNDVRIAQCSIIWHDYKLQIQPCNESEMSWNWSVYIAGADFVVLE